MVKLRTLAPYCLFDPSNTSRSTSGPAWFFLIFSAWQTHSHTYQGTCPYKVPWRLSLYGCRPSPHIVFLIPLSVKRPALTLSGQSIDLEDYDHFKYQYKQYKARLGDSTDNPSCLLECLAEDVSKMLFSSLGPEMTNLMEAELFDNISASCMTKQTVQASTELHRIKQDPSQSVQNFLANLKSKARQCEMKLVCTNMTCQTINFYSDPVILGLFINGVNDTELQQATEEGGSTK